MTRLFETVLVKAQFKEFVMKNHVDQYGDRVDLYVTVRFDDQCGNGHNTMSVTGTMYKPGKKSDRFDRGGGCIHDEISSAFPSLKTAINYHLSSTDGPMHYLANSLYHASDKDCSGYAKGQPNKFETRIKFGDFPMLFDVGASMLRMIKDNFDFTNAEIEEYFHPEKETYGSRFRIKGYEKYCETSYAEDKQWYNCSHSDRAKLESFIECCQKYKIDIITTITGWSDGKIPDLKGARNCAVWPEAELEDFTEEKLLNRLPELLGGLKKVVEDLGMVF